jgi:hypothetical protein
MHVLDQHTHALLHSRTNHIHQRTVSDDQNIETITSAQGITTDAGELTLVT